MDFKMMNKTYAISSPGRVRGKRGKVRGALFPVRGESAESTWKPGELIVQCGGSPEHARVSPGGYLIPREAFPTHRIVSSWSFVMMFAPVICVL